MQVCGPSVWKTIYSRATCANFGVGRSMPVEGYHTSKNWQDFTISDKPNKNVHRFTGIINDITL